MSEPLRFLGVVDDTGALRLDNPARWRLALLGMKGKRAEVTLDAERRVRTPPQLRRYFKCIVPVVAAVLNSKRDPVLPPLSKEQTHRLIMGAFVGHDETPLGLVPIESKTLTPAQFADLSDRVEAHFRAEGIPFPLLDETVEVGA